jgi:hypothetical protein
MTGAFCHTYRGRPCAEMMCASRSPACCLRSGAAAVLPCNSPSTWQAPAGRSNQWMMAHGLLREVLNFASALYIAMTSDCLAHALDHAFIRHLQHTMLEEKTPSLLMPLVELRSSEQGLRYLRPAAASAAGPRLRTRCVPDGPSFVTLFPLRSFFVHWLG